MPRFLLLCVTYHSYPELHTYLASVAEAARAVSGQPWQVDVCVADNTDTDSREPAFRHPSLHSVRVFPFHRNLGYFGAVQAMTEQLQGIDAYDYVAISNVDLEMPADFFVRLASLRVGPQVGWIANAILSGLENRDRNPKIRQRYTPRRLKQLRLLFRFPILHYLYQHTLYLRKRVATQPAPTHIYAGHGSFILLTQAFVRQYPQLHYPVFLFGEEIYLAELCRQAQLQVRYEPSLIIRDTEHASTGRMRKSFYYRCNYEALDYLINTYY